MKGRYSYSLKELNKEKSLVTCYVLTKVLELENVNCEKPEEIFEIAKEKYGQDFLATIYRESEPIASQKITNIKTNSHYDLQNSYNKLINKGKEMINKINNNSHVNK